MTHLLRSDFGLACIGQDTKLQGCFHKHGASLTQTVLGLSRVNIGLHRGIAASRIRCVASIRYEIVFPRIIQAEIDDAFNIKVDAK